MIPAFPCKKSPSNRRSILRYKHFIEHLVCTSKNPQLEAKIEHGTEPSTLLVSKRQRQLRAPMLELKD
jgi:hypothetical protein